MGSVFLLAFFMTVAACGCAGQNTDTKTQDWRKAKCSFIEICEEGVRKSEDGRHTGSAEQF